MLRSVPDDMNLAIRRRAGRQRPTREEVGADLNHALDEAERAQAAGDDAGARRAQEALAQLVPLARELGILRPEPKAPPTFDGGIRGAGDTNDQDMDALIRAAAGAGTITRGTR
jgi:hypothetical protein